MNLLDQLWFVFKVIFVFSLAVCFLVAVCAVYLDRRQRKHQRRYVLEAPSLVDCERRYIP